MDMWRDGEKCETNVRYVDDNGDGIVQQLNGADKMGRLLDMYDTKYPGEKTSSYSF